VTSLYRRHRPQSFDEVVGQQHIVRTLRNAVEQDKVHHAYLFVGSRGTGKTSMAKILARSLNCVKGPTVEPCGECESCRSIAEGTSLDVIEMDAASNRSVDDIRDLRDRVGYLPAAGRWKVYILDEAHMLTKEAWNAFLKTLEEPPPHTVFVLATTEAHKVMPTIVDRCQRFDFHRPTLEQIAEVLHRVAQAEKIEIDDAAIGMIARAATGSFRDALGTLDQLVAFGGDEVALDDVLTVLGAADADLLFDTTEGLIAGDGAEVLRCVDRLASSGRDLPQFGRDLVSHLRHLLVIGITGEVPESFSVTATEPDRLREQAGRLERPAALRAIEQLSSALAQVKEGADARVMLEMALLAAAQPEMDASLQALLHRIDQLETRLGGQAIPPPSAPAAVATEREPEPEAPAVPPPAPPGPAAAVAVEIDPATEPAPAPAAEAEDPGGVDLERLRALWPAVIEQIAQSGAMVLSTVFTGARPVEVQGSSFAIGFPPGATFNKKKAEERSNRERLTEAVRAVTGHRLTPLYQLLEGADAGAESGEPELSEEELIDRIKSEFNATEQEVEP
jgi:DNA polymerase-3 subunit gamma/tau